MKKVLAFFIYCIAFYYFNYVIGAKNLPQWVMIFFFSSGVIIGLYIVFKIIIFWQNIPEDEKLNFSGSHNYISDEVYECPVSKKSLKSRKEYLERELDNINDRFKEVRINSEIYDLEQKIEMIDRFNELVETRKKIYSRLDNMKLELNDCETLCNVAKNKYYRSDASEYSYEKGKLYDEWTKLEKNKKNTEQNYKNSIEMLKEIDNELESLTNRLSY